MANNQKEKVKELTLSDIFIHLKEYYTIPPYQRNYAWGAKEIEQLIQDVIDQSRLKTNRNYYIGTLVTYYRVDGKFEVIDGQQRLTTLTLLIKALELLNSSNKNQNLLTDTQLILKFDSRKKSMAAIESIWRGNHDTGCSLGGGYNNICKYLREKLGTSGKQENDSTDNSNPIGDFTKFLLNNVKIIRVIVPQDTDLNHYFEIMNNRGEQLEKHEILKAKFMSRLSKPEDKITFAKIWDACANMDKYVQYGFKPTERNSIFSVSWDKFQVNGFEDINITDGDNSFKDTDSCRISIENILKDRPNSTKINEKEDSERFSSIIDFPNFLLHILRVFVNTQDKFNNSSKEFKDILLDDKRLLNSFEVIFEKYEEQDLIKYFAYELLRGKFLFDKYIIKREISKGIAGWELQTLVGSTDKNKSIYYKNTFDDAKDVIMLQAMFHVSTPSSNYKYWLDGALFHLMRQANNETETTEYQEYLKTLASRFVYERYLSSEPKEYYTMIYNKPDDRQVSNDPINDGLLIYGEIRNNLVFNYIDYLLWSNQYNEIFPNDDVFEDEYSKKNYEVVRNSFVFTFRSSVEHYYPQNPVDGIKKLDDKDLHSFGNLCLVSHEQNSRLGNVTPRAKSDYYKDKFKNKKIDSMKQYLMMSYSKWDETSIADHDRKMYNLLKNDFEIIKLKTN